VSSLELGGANANQKKKKKPPQKPIMGDNNRVVIAKCKDVSKASM
jgi:hypothetical protein